MPATIPLSAVRVPQGKVAVTLDLARLPCITGLVDADRVDDLLQGFEESLGLSATDRSDVRTHVALRRELCSQFEAMQSEAATALIAFGLWLTFNHPLEAQRIRTSVSRDLREKGRAQVTVTCDDRGKWGFAASERPAEQLTELLEVVPDGAALVLNGEPEEDAKSFS
jgi:hypothetical protein